MINSRQAINEYSDAQDSIKFNSDRGLESYMCLVEDMRNIIEHLNNSNVQTGIIAPENEITSNNSQFYFDTSTSTMYTNPDIGVNTGWIAL